ncbi:MAG: hypothetical protein LAP40_18255 [Acidobacteriia bacterium]|nr:hypothetical protein [Terriglobia bacterium]
MFRAWLVLAALSLGSASGQAPSYSAANIVNAINLASGPVAPNSYISLFGANLAWREESLTVENTAAGALPQTLADIRVYVANYVAPLLYAGPSQINFLVPGNLSVGQVMVRVARQGVTGPEVPITLVDVAPHLFAYPNGYVLAQHTDYSAILPDNPAHPGEIVVVYANGLGATHPNPDPGEIPWYAGLMTRLSDLRVSIGGSVLTPDRILYAGLTPGWAGLYQINLRLPEVLGPDPEIRAAVGAQSSLAGLKLAAVSQ